MRSSAIVYRSKNTTMASGELPVDPYKTLGLDVNPDLTEGEIKKAFRKLALKLHPDKRSASEREVAEKEFDQLQKAYDILLDPEARAALDALSKARKAREEREGKQDAKRRKMREELERRERMHEQQKNEEEAAKERLQQELARLRKDYASRKKNYDVPTDGGCAETSAAATKPPAEQLEKMYCALKVVWRKDISDYTIGRLQEIFSAFGTVEDIVIRDSKKKKGSALVMFSTEAETAKAASAQCGDPSNPLLSVRAAIPDENRTKPSSAQEPESQPQTRTSANQPEATTAGAAPRGGFGGKAFHSADTEGAGKAAGADGERGGGGGLFPGSSRGFGPSLFPGGAPLFSAPGSNLSSSMGNVHNRDFENVVLDRLRRAQEKARLIADMEKEEGGDDLRP